MTSVPRANLARTLKERLREREVHYPGYWNFADTPRRGGGHAFFQYPAMMVPELQGALLDELLDADSSVATVYDPFMGSGTVLLEALYRGLDFHGVDINPMAALLSYVKSCPPSEKRALELITSTLTIAQKSSADPHDFPGAAKWFTAEVLLQLSLLRHCIQLVESLDERRFLWVCLAEVVRLVSNSRTSTVKLHLYAPDDLKSRRPNAFSVFSAVGRANSLRSGQHWTRFKEAPNRFGQHTRSINIQRGSILSDIIGPVTTDAIMTSPPYGDNQTTVTYGQHSYLPLQWIDPKDHLGHLEPELLSAISALDRKSLGGSVTGALKKRRAVEEKSPALAQFLSRIDHRPDLVKKVVAFSSDYERAIGRATRPLRRSGFSFWTLGERRVGGVAVPLVRITAELLGNIGHEQVEVVDRKLPMARKRMAPTNQLGVTMSSEHILIAQRR